MTVTRVRRVAAAVRADRGRYYDEFRDRRILVPVLLELAHAISRGRKPASCSLLPGVNLREWIYDVYSNERSYCRDAFGENCSLIEDLNDTLGWFPSEENEKLLRVILLVGKHLWKPKKKERDIRGDFFYQKNHRVTNLKRKAKYLAERNGSCYSWDDRDYGVDLEIRSRMAAV